MVPYTGGGLAITIKMPAMDKNPTEDGNGLTEVVPHIPIGIRTIPNSPITITEMKIVDTLMLPTLIGMISTAAATTGTENPSFMSASHNHKHLHI